MSYPDTYDDGNGMAVNQASLAVTIVLAGEPRGKGRPRFSRASGMAYTPAATRTYEASLSYVAQQAMDGRAPLQGPVTVQMVARFGIPKSFSAKKRDAALAGSLVPTKRPDADNLAKVLDGLNRIVFDDDAQVVNLSLQKRYGSLPGLTIVVQPA